MKIIISPYCKKLRDGKENPKNYPISYWQELIRLLLERQHEIIQIGQDGEEKLVNDCRFNLSFKELKQLLIESDFFISVDTFLPHMANHYGKKGIVIFSQSDPQIFGYSSNVNLLKDRKYLREKQFDIWEYTGYNKTVYNKEAFVEPADVIKYVNNC